MWRVEVDGCDREGGPVKGLDCVGWFLQFAADCAGDRARKEVVDAQVAKISSLSQRSEGIARWARMMLTMAMLLVMAMISRTSKMVKVKLRVWE